MWLSREEEEKQKELEKLIDWELNRQLTWAVVFLTTLLGLLALLGTGLLKQWIVFNCPLICIDYYKAPLVAIFFILLLFGVDLGFYRLADTTVTLRNFVEGLPNKRMREELLKKTILGGLYNLFLKRTDKNRFSLRTEFVWLLIVLGDILFIWALVSIG